MKFHPEPVAMPLPVDTVRPLSPGASEDATPALRRGRLYDDKSVFATTWHFGFLRRTTNMTLEDDLRDLRARRAAALTKKVRAEADRDAAVERLDQANATLATHGVKTPAQGKKKLDELTAKLDAKRAEVEQALVEAGA